MSLEFAATAANLFLVSMVELCGDLMSIEKSSFSSITREGSTANTELKRKPRISLLDLPREIRDIIYSFALQSHTGFVLFRQTPNLGGPRCSPFHPAWSSENCYTPTTGPRIATSLLETCTQIKCEASPYFYALNTFICFPSLPQSRPVKLMHRIQHIWIDGYVADLYGRHVSPERLRKELYFVHSLPELKTVRLSLVRQGQGMFDLVRNGRHLAACLDELQQDRIIWESLLSNAIANQGSEIAKKRQVRRILDVASMATPDWRRPTDYALGIRQLHEAWGGELWFCDSLWIRGCEQPDVVDHFEPGVLPLVS